MKLCWFRVGPKCSDWCPIGRGEDADPQRKEALVKMGPQAKESRSPQSLEETRKDHPLAPAEGTWPCLRLDFRRLASCAGRE